MSGEHTLRIRCPTWQHLESFYESKVKDGNVLLARVPFTPSLESRVTIALELPDGLVVSIEARVEGVRSAPDGRKAAIRLALLDMEDVRPRLKRAVEVGHQNMLPRQQGPSSIKPPRTQTGLLVPIPSDAPIDEPVDVVRLPPSGEVAAQVRSQYVELEHVLAAMREKAAHDVLGVEWDAEVSDIRVAYFVLVKKYHPDVLSKHDSSEISLLGSEIFIYINKAYDRLRDSAVAAGKAITAGPALLPSTGWIADFDDLGAVRPHATYRVTDLAEAVPVPVKAMSSMAVNAPEMSEKIRVKFSAKQQDELFEDARSTRSGMKPLEEETQHDAEQAEEHVDVSALLEKGRALLEATHYDEARVCLAELLEHAPRNRAARALYHVAYGKTLLERSKEVAATTQFEVALRHDPTCKPAIEASEGGSAGSRQRRPSLLERLFRR